MKYFSRGKAVLKCFLAVSKCPLFVLERSPSCREFSYSKRKENREGPEPRVRLTELNMRKTRTLLWLATLLFPLEEVYEKLVA